MKILIIDDEEADVILVRRALKDLFPNIETIHKANGLEALNELNQMLTSTQDLIPDLILLDINMPKMDGKEFIVKLRSHQDSKIKRIPTVVLTTSAAENDINHMYASGANCYIVKEDDFDDFKHNISALMNFWTNISSRPNR